MTFNESDLEIVTGCAADHPSRLGGQHVAKSCSGVMVIHKPTGIAVRSLDERSQYKNKRRAIERLRIVVEAFQLPFWESVSELAALRDAIPAERRAGSGVLEALRRERAAPVPDDDAASRAMGVCRPCGTLLAWCRCEDS